LFDSRTVVRMHIDDTDTTIGVEVIEDEAQVLAACPRCRPGCGNPYC
jgi:hypothetical protein